jgi:NADH-quinone oxidoreductase subunit L
MPILEHLWIIPLLPLLGATVNGLFGRTWPNKIVNSVAIGATGLSFLAALEAAREFFLLSPEQIPWVKQYFSWIEAGNFRAGFDLQVDQLTVVMLLVVTGVGWLIHIYSTGYMAHEGGYYRFFAYLNLFMFFMLILVLAANYVLLFVGWEGVGLASYLLIGFYFLRKSAAGAGKKAFIVNRIGDFGFMLGMFLLFRTFGTLDFVKLFDKATPLSAEAMGHLGTLTVACLLLFMGAAGKSAHHGHGGSVRGGAIACAVYARADGHAGGSGGGLRDGIICGDDWVGADGHQEGVGIFHGEPVGVHVPRLRGGRVFGGNFSLDDARVF